MSEIEESAKAVQELAKLGRHSLEKLDRIESMGTKILGPIAQGWGILTDLSAHARHVIKWRMNNREAVYRAAFNKMLEAGIRIENIQTVPDRIAYYYETGLEQEDDVALQQLWANLLINVSHPHKQVSPKKIFRDILQRMEADDAALLQLIGYISWFNEGYPLTPHPGPDTFRVTADVEIHRTRDAGLYPAVYDQRFSIEDGRRDQEPEYVIGPPWPPYKGRAHIALDDNPDVKIKNEEITGVIARSGIARVDLMHDGLQFFTERDQVACRRHHVATLSWSLDRSEITVDRLIALGLIRSYEPRKLNYGDFGYKVYHFTKLGQDLFAAVRDPCLTRKVD